MQSGFANPPSGGYAPGPPPEGAPYAGAFYGGFQQPQYGQSVVRQTNLKQEMAIASLILGCLAPFSCACVLFGIGPMIGTVLGIVAAVKAQRYPAQYGGKTIAIIGIVLNGFFLLGMLTLAIIGVALNGFSLLEMLRHQR
jgi:hypothetical protein